MKRKKAKTRRKIGSRTILRIVPAGIVPTANEQPPTMFTMYLDPHIVPNPELVRTRSVAKIPYADFLKTLGRDK